MTVVARDPVCGMVVLPGKDITVTQQGRTVMFCSELCRERFLEWPERYLRRLSEGTPPLDEARRRIAYFSMEVGVEPGMPTYSGGLGVLAGDTLRAFADLEIPAVGVTLFYRDGYFRQEIDETGWQREHVVAWQPERFMRLLEPVTDVEIGGRRVVVRAWRHPIVGLGGFVVPLLLLDTQSEHNTPEDRRLTDTLYGGDQPHRLAQEAILGIGGPRMPRALGYTGVTRFHMNEGHASLLGLELLRESGAQDAPDWGLAGVRERCVFTTHTPVPAGHDQFDYGLVSGMLGELVPRELLQMLGGRERLNMTRLALNLSGYVNGVAQRHEEVSEEMFPGYPIHHITNGVHSVAWTAGSFRDLYDRHIPGWRKDPAMLRHALRLPGGELWAAHQAAKSELLGLVRERAGVVLDADVLTVGLARRATSYKRLDLLLTDLERLKTIAREKGRLQVVFAGKAHPRDLEGKRVIQRVMAAGRQLAGSVPVVYLADYDLEMARILVARVDLWLNTPLPPLEASGTSGMKAAHNGVPSLSVLDGWWLEGHIEGVTGWCIGDRDPATSGDDAQDLYRKLADPVLPLFYGRREAWIDVMRHAIALNAAYFNTHRMAQEYVAHAYV